MLHIECPECGHLNALSLDDLLGKYAECGGCLKLINIVNALHTHQDEERGSNDNNEEENNLR